MSSSQQSRAARSGPLGRWTMTKKLSVMLLTFGMLPAGAVAWVALDAAHGIEDSAARELKAKARDLGDVIDRNLYERYGDVQAFAANPVIASGDKDAIVAAMNTYAALYGVYDLMILVDPDGKVLAVNDKDASGRSINSESIYRKNYKDAEWVRALAAGRFTTSQPHAAAGNTAATGTFVEDAHVDPDVRAVLGNDAGYSLGFSARVEQGGKLIGYWSNRAKVSIVEDIALDAYRDLKEEGHPDAELLVVNAAGHPVVSVAPASSGREAAVRDDSVILQPTNGEDPNGPLPKAQAGETGYMVSVHPRDGDVDVAGYAPLEGALGWPGMPWGVVVRIPEESLFADVHSLRTRMVVSLVVAMVATLLAGVLLARRMSQPIIRMAAAAQKVAAGRLDIRIDEAGHDEIGTLADAFRQMVSRLSSTLTSVRSAADQVAASSAQVSSAGRDLADNSTTSAASLQQIRASMVSISRQTEENSARVEHAQELSATMRDAADSGDEQMRSMVQAMGEIDRSAQEISKVIKVIDDIAFQINLLSLNAAVEAARAGEHGRGFAVVAEEVRNLATRSAKAARETGQLIETAIAKATNGTEIAEATATGLSRIVKGIQQISDITDKVASATRQQASAVNEVNQGISQVDEVTQNNTASAEELAAAATELSGNASRLQEGLKRFTLRQSHSSGGGADHGAPSGNHDHVFEQEDADGQDEPGEWLHREYSEAGDYGRY